MPLSHTSRWGRRAGTESGIPGELDGRGSGAPDLEPDSIHPVTASTGIRISRLGWNAMKPGIDGG